MLANSSRLIQVLTVLYITLSRPNVNTPESKGLGSFALSAANGTALADLRPHLCHLILCGGAASCGGSRVKSWTGACSQFRPSLIATSS